jgi:hypothetical protein
MSDALISRSPDLKRLDEEGFELEIRGGFLLVHAVPYVKTDRTLARGILVCELTLSPSGECTVAPRDHTIYFAGDTPCHRDGSPLLAIINNSNRTDFGNDIVVHHYFSSKPEGTGRYDNFYDKIVAYEGHLGRPARSHDPSANARTGQKLSASTEASPFMIPDTASARYGLGAINRKLELRRVAIIGLGGTGSYVLDLVSKTPVQEIHLYDGDQFLNHNVFRAPGTPELGATKEFPSKVEYFAKIYSRLHPGLIAHNVKVTSENVDELKGFDFAFICVDRGSARRAIAGGLHRLNVPFIDTGIGVGLENDQLDGCTRVSFTPAGADWTTTEQYLPFGDDDEGEDDVYNKGIQIADLNALNATLAVLRWKRSVGFYRDLRGELNSAYMVEGNMLTNRNTNATG